VSTATEGGLHRHYRTSARQQPQRADCTGPACQQPLRADSDRHYQTSACQQPQRADSTGRRQTPVQPRGHLRGPGGEVRKGAHPEVVGANEPDTRGDRKGAQTRKGGATNRSPTQAAITIHLCTGAAAIVVRLHTSCFTFRRSISCIVSPSDASKDCSKAIRLHSRNGERVRARTTRRPHSDTMHGNDQPRWIHSVAQVHIPLMPS